MSTEVAMVPFKVVFAYIALVWLGFACSAVAHPCVSDAEERPQRAALPATVPATF